MAKEIVLAGACRTALGKFGGTLTNTPAVELGAIVIKEAIRRAGIKPEDVDEVLMGNVLQAGLGQSPARQAAEHAGSLAVDDRDRRQSGGGSRTHHQPRMRFRPEGRQHGCCDD